MEMEGMGYGNKKLKAPIFASKGVSTVQTEVRERANHIYFLRYDRFAGLKKNCGERNICFLKQRKQGDRYENKHLAIFNYL